MVAVCRSWSIFSQDTITQLACAETGCQYLSLCHSLGSRSLLWSKSLNLNLTSWYSFSAFLCEYIFENSTVFTRHNAFDCVQSYRLRWSTDQEFQSCNWIHGKYPLFIPLPPHGSALEHCFFDSTRAQPLMRPVRPIIVALRASFFFKWVTKGAKPG